jgi:hypothetical protein
MACSGVMIWIFKSWVSWSFRYVLILEIKLRSCARPSSSQNTVGTPVYVYIHIYIYMYIYVYIYISIYIHIYKSIHSNLSLPVARALETANLTQSLIAISLVWHIRQMSPSPTACSKMTLPSPVTLTVPLDLILMMMMLT